MSIFQSICQTFANIAPKLLADMIQDAMQQSERWSDAKKQKQNISLYGIIQTGCV